MFFTVPADWASSHLQEIPSPPGQVLLHRALQERVVARNVPILYLLASLDQVSAQ